MYQYKATVVKIKDGDTLVLNVDLGLEVSTNQTFRIYGINTPEVIGVEKVAGLKAKKRVEELLFIGTEVTINTFKDKKEKYGRYLVQIILSTGQSIADILLTEGLANEYYGVGVK